ncbi:hypothetical protein ATANTOWER_028677 [Ataeniobius toweri]|uniref:Uncharacterized protein n=1 Tax=Ataeniobius toweri TaxID=208326 RepID=A0ABU7C712_9TELE|nr:hypothetical protein [Ataeniobius toweri]
MDSRLVLAREAVPTISLPDSHPPDIAGADVAAIDNGIAGITEGRIIRPTNEDTEVGILLRVVSVPPADTPLAFQSREI